MLDITLPVPAKLSAASPLARRFVCFQLSFGVPFYVEFLMCPQALLSRKCFAVAGGMGTGWRMGGANMVLQRRPCRIICRRLAWRGEAILMYTCVPFVYGGGSGRKYGKLYEKLTIMNLAMGM